MTLLQAEGVSIRYGPSPIVHEASVTIGPGEVVALLGRNGVGKTTLARGLMGLLPVTAGRVLVNGVDVTRKPAHQIARAGVRIVPQGRGVFPRLTVAENLQVGAYLRRGRSSRLDALVDDLFPVLRERRGQRAGTLSGGEQQMLAIARALISEPAVVILDEPTEGVAPVLIDRIEQALRIVFAETGVGVLLIEQNLDFAFALAQRGYVMEKGLIVLAAPLAEMRGPAVEQYLAF
jgi:ABC-type branched-subunit amino acid transport system ATPase component